MFVNCGSLGGPQGIFRRLAEELGLEVGKGGSAAARATVERHLTTTEEMV